MNADERRAQILEEARLAAEGEPAHAEDRRITAAGTLAADTATNEALLAGLSVPRDRLDPATLQRCGEPLEGEPVVLTDELALRVDASRKIRKPGTTGDTSAPASPRGGVTDVTDVPARVPTDLSRNASDARNACSALLGELATFVRQFVVLAEEQDDAVALWVLHTHAFAAAHTTPYLSITSAEKRSGKTQLLEVLETVAARPWLTGRTTTAALVRKIDGVQPTLLLDESDAAFSGVLNSGFRHSGKATVCVVQGANISYVDLGTFCPKAIARIGRLPDTVEDRSILIRLVRKTRGEHVERWRSGRPPQEAEQLRDRAAEFASEDTLKTLYVAEPELPDELHDRAQDVWEPLLAIAEFAGGSWPERAQRAAVILSSNEEDESLGVRLLADIRKVFDGTNRPELTQPPRDSIKTVELLWELTTIDTSPWGNWYGKSITAHSVSKLLREWQIRTIAVRVDGEVVRGYKREQFWDAWERYLPDGDVGVTPAEGVTPEAASEAACNARNASNAHSGEGAEESLSEGESEQSLDEELRDAQLLAGLEADGTGRLLSEEGA